MTAIRVLVADDEPEVVSALEALFAAATDLELVGSAGDAVEAVSLAGRLRPDVALIDVRMPGGGGAQAAREIKQLSPQTQVVAFSAYDDRASVFQMLENGAVSYLVKGASVGEIRDALVSAACGKSVLSSEVASEVVHEFAGQLERNAQIEAGKRERIARVRRALESGALEVVFQPIVELASRDPIGFEVLARFRIDPLRSPDLWFREANEIGLGLPLEAAALQLAIASKLPPDTFISVNVCW